jgi:hypothetical protein
MPLLSIWKSNPEAILSMSIEQIVSSSGNGQLKDDSECSVELRAFLSQAPSGKLIAYASHYLNSAFNKSGLVLQDVVNELGRRLGYKVINGRYQGTVNSIGNDGLWIAPSGHCLLVEVKTTDAYRIPLNKIAAYRDGLVAEGKISKSNSMLLVVGRDDTGELEAQVRGSRHAWDMRLLSVDALFRLVNLIEKTDSGKTEEKIRSLLVPFEYTRLDELIDIVFTAATEAGEDVEQPLAEIRSKEKDSTSYSATPKEILEKVRDSIVNSFATKNDVKLIRKSRVLYWDDSHKFRIACAISKRYAESGAVYWYAYHQLWHDFISEEEVGYYILGCTDQKIAFAIPAKLMLDRAKELNTTSKDDGSVYWHVKINESSEGEYYLQMPKSGKHVALKSYAFKIS